MTLTPEQRAAVESDLDETVVSAGAGSGKTTVLVARAVHLIANGVDARSIAILTFTRSAAAEIRSRIVELLGWPAAPEVSTFHGLAHKLLGSPRVATEAEAEAALRSLYSGPMRRKDAPGIETVRDAIARHEAGVETAEEKWVGIVWDRLAQASLVPLWDLVPTMTRPRVRVHPPFSHVLVDESQDITRHEEAFARALAPRRFFVGDPCQSIFQWRYGFGIQAKPTHRLAQSFRFGAGIAEEANKIADRFGGERVVGHGSGGGIIREWRWALGGIRSNVTGPSADDILRDGQRTLFLARTNHECDLIARQIDRQITRGAVHVRRDPLDPFSAESDRFEDVWQRGGIVVSTVHAARGREADRVVVCMDLEREPGNAEERRIDYVAVTRAKSELIFAPKPEER